MRGQNLQSSSIEKVVVRGVNWIGDAVMTIPALRELRRLFPQAHLTLATRSWARGLFADAEYLDELLIYDRSPGGFLSFVNQAKEWRCREFDLAVLFQNAFEAALLAYLARIPLRFGYSTERRSLLLTHALPLPEWRQEKHEVFYYLNIVGEIERQFTGASDVAGREPVDSLALSAGRKEEARDLLRSLGADPFRPVVVLCPGSTNSRAKRWPAGYYAALGDLFMDQTDAQVLLVGSADEIEVSHEVAQQMRHRPIMLTGRTELSQAVAVVSLASVVISNDTGPAHIGAALGRPTLVLFGPTNPVTTRPFSAAAEVIRHPPECAPCMLRDCPIDHRCMTVISPAEVFARACAIMERTPAEVQV